MEEVTAAVKQMKTQHISPHEADKLMPTLTAIE